VELKAVTTTEFSYGRSVSWRSGPKMYRQLSSVGLKSPHGMYFGPSKTWIGTLNDVTTSQ